jgi:hypothetical protein
LRLFLNRQPEEFLDGMSDSVARAQIIGALQSLAGETYSGAICRSADFAGGRYTFVGTRDEWKITFHIVEEPEPILSVVTIKKRRTWSWALEFYPKRDCNE